jgi:hypothetical protein
VGILDFSGGVPSEIQAASVSAKATVYNRTDRLLIFFAPPTNEAGSNASRKVPVFALTKPTIAFITIPRGLSTPPKNFFTDPTVDPIAKLDGFFGSNGHQFAL